MNTLNKIADSVIIMESIILVASELNEQQHKGEI
jgi:hypothetical protein